MIYRAMMAAYRLRAKFCGNSLAANPGALQSEKCAEIVSQQQGGSVKVAIHYYGNEPENRQEVAEIVKANGLEVTEVNEHWHEVAVPSQHSAEALLKDLSPVANVQLQTLA